MSSLNDLRLRFLQGHSLTTHEKARLDQDRIKSNGSTDEDLQVQMPEWSEPPWDFCNFPKLNLYDSDLMRVYFSSHQFSLRENTELHEEMQRTGATSPDYSRCSADMFARVKWMQIAMEYQQNQKMVVLRDDPSSLRGATVIIFAGSSVRLPIKQVASRGNDLAAEIFKQQQATRVQVGIPVCWLQVDPTLNERDAHNFVYPIGARFVIRKSKSQAAVMEAYDVDSETHDIMLATLKRHGQKLTSDYSTRLTHLIQNQIPTRKYNFTASYVTQLIPDDSIKRAQKKKKKRKKKKQKKEAADAMANRTCNFCGKIGDEIRVFPKCAKCKKVFYCQKSCQVSDWKIHKKQCVKASVAVECVGTWVTLDLTRGFEPILRTGKGYILVKNMNSSTGKPIAMGIEEYESSIEFMLHKYPNGKQFVVKVQVPSHKVTGELVENGACQIYDKSRTLLCYATPDISGPNNYNSLTTAILNTAHKKTLKGYFSCMIEREKSGGRKVLKVRVDEELSAENMYW